MNIKILKLIQSTKALNKVFLDIELSGSGIIIQGIIVEKNKNGVEVFLRRRTKEDGNPYTPIRFVSDSIRIDFFKEIKSQLKILLPHFFEVEEKVQ